MENPAVLAVLAILAALVTALTVLLLRKTRSAPTGPDPSVVLMQQQITRLAEQISLVGAQIPKEVGASLNQLTGQLAARLSENAQSLQKASADTGKLIADINHRLGDLGRSSQEILSLGQDIRGLQQIFQAPKVRGGLGEMALGVLLQEAFPAENFALQYAFQDGLTVDAVLRLPGGLVPIDSKFPLAGFRQLLEAAAGEPRDRARKQFAREVRKHVDDIASKYIRPSEGTFDFALMYIPGENIFYELIARDASQGDEDVNDYAAKCRVIPVSPNSILAYLKPIAYGLMGLRVEERARQIVKRLQQLHGDFGSFRDAFDLGLKHLRNAQTAFGDADRRAERVAVAIQQAASVTEETTTEPRPLPDPVLSETRFKPRSLDQ